MVMVKPWLDPVGGSPVESHVVSTVPSHPDYSVLRQRARDARESSRKENEFATQSNGPSKASSVARSSSGSRFEAPAA